jgi:hypothetical protein
MLLVTVKKEIFSTVGGFIGVYRPNKFIFPDVKERGCYGRRARPPSRRVFQAAGAAGPRSCESRV